ncbi:MAG TPA: dihydroneopterin aldolase [Candidatus Omnitrophota bacterium]|nr:dihydroneopterin aldolase [Candidatus Omnitrophota bacterium]
MLDRILIKDLRAKCVIGVWKKERRRKQAVAVSISLSTDLRKAGRSDLLQDAVNYHDLENRVLALIGNSKYYLLETLAEAVAKVCLNDRRVKEVCVRVEKPAASKHAKSIGVEIQRIRK